MRARRPYLYSDTKEVEASDLTRDVFSYHLETLTKQKDETRFEVFAQRLAQKFISPNIRPQTDRRPVGMARATPKLTR